MPLSFELSNLVNVNRVLGKNMHRKTFDKDRKIVQNARGEFICPGCGKVYKYKTSVYTHLKNECGIEPKYRCAPCGFACKFYHVLQRHKLSLVHRRKEAANIKEEADQF